LNSKNIYAVLLIGILLVTIFLHLHDFDLPAINVNEPWFFVPVQTLMNPPDSDLYYIADYFAQNVGDFPISHRPYVGALEDYLSSPLVYFLGINPTTIRLYQTILACAVILFTFFAGRELFSNRIGIVSAALLATMPVFVFWSRQFVLYGWSDVVILLLIIIFGMRYIKNSEKKYLFGVLFLIGIGIWGYLWFVWFVIGFLFTIPLFYNKINLKSKLQDSKFLLLITGFLGLGFIPLIIQHIIHPKGALIPLIVNTISDKSGFLFLTSDNTNFIGNFLMRIEHFVVILIHPKMGLFFSDVDITLNDNQFYSIYFTCILHCSWAITRIF